jgi:hypothetical protein
MMHLDSSTRQHLNCRTKTRSQRTEGGLFPPLHMGSHLEAGKRFEPPFLAKAKLTIQQEPRFLKHDSKEREAMLESLLMQKPIQRICKFASSE